MAYYYYTDISEKEGLLLFSKIVVGVFLFHTIKMFLFKVAGWIFRSAQATSDYVLNFYIFGQISGMVILPIVIFVCYMNNLTIMYLGIVLFAILYLYHLLRGLTITLMNAKISLYYIILYLCTLEILPLVILGIFFIR